MTIAGSSADGVRPRYEHAAVTQEHGTRDDLAILQRGDSRGARLSGADRDTDLRRPQRGDPARARTPSRRCPLSKEGKSGDPANFILQGITYKGELATVAYVHVSPNVLVKPGDRVEAGQQLGLSGYNGHATGPHLHIAAMTKHRSRPVRVPQRHPEVGGRARERRGLQRYLYLPAAPGVPTRASAPDGARSSRCGRPEVRHARLRFRRRLQHRLNGIPLEGGVELSERGNYLEQTRDEVRRWQPEKRGLKPGSPLADGDIHPKQAQLLFGKRFELV